MSSNNLIRIGDSKAPTPKMALTKMSHELALFPLIPIRHIFVAVRTQYRLLPMQSQVTNSQKGDLMFEKMLRNTMSISTWQDITLCPKFENFCFCSHLNTTKPTMLPSDLATNRKEYDVSGRPDYLAR